MDQTASKEGSADGDIISPAVRLKLEQAIAKFRTTAGGAKPPI